MSRLGFSDQAYESLRQMGLVPLRDPHYEPATPASTPPQSLTNAQKLSLPANTSVGKQVSVTNGFVLHDATYGDVFYYTNGTAPSGGTAPAIEKYSPANRPDLDDITWRWNNANDASAGGAWGDGGGNYAGLGDGSVTHFWTTPVETIDHTYTVTYPAVQELAAPSAAQGGVFVTGGTQDGVYTKRGTINGKDSFELLGSAIGWNINQCSWTNDATEFGPFSAGFIGALFVISDVGGNPLYYSASDVATPDLASDWKNVSDDSPASITVTSVSAGDVNAGVTVAGAGTASVSGTVEVDGAFSIQGVGLFGASPGWNYYNKIGHSNSPNWSQYFFGDHWAMSDSEDTAGFLGTITAFPWQADWSANDSNPPAPTVTRNDVASEANWSVVP